MTLEFKGKVLMTCRFFRKGQFGKQDKRTIKDCQKNKNEKKKEVSKYHEKQ